MANEAADAFRASSHDTSSRRWSEKGGYRNTSNGKTNPQRRR